MTESCGIDPGLNVRHAHFLCLLTVVKPCFFRMKIGTFHFVLVANCANPSFLCSLASKMARSVRLVRLFSNSVTILLVCCCIDLSKRSALNSVEPNPLESSSSSRKDGTIFYSVTLSLASVPPLQLASDFSMRKDMWRDTCQLWSIICLIPRVRNTIKL